jgi:hypothetical protein
MKRTLNKIRDAFIVIMICLVTFFLFFSFYSNVFNCNGIVIEDAFGIWRCLEQ